MFKVCSKCKENLPVDSFGQRKNRGEGHYKSRCKGCERATRAAGDLTKSEYNEIMASAIACDICDDLFNEGDQKNLDHDHDTGEVRGVLCRNCNIALGYLKETPRNFRKAMVYINKSPNCERSVRA